MCAVIRSRQIPLEWLKGAYVVHMGMVNTDTMAYVLRKHSYLLQNANPAHTHSALLFSAL